MPPDLPPQPGTLSLPVKMAAKKKNIRAGIMTLVPGVALLGAAVYAFTLGGAALLGILATALGAGLVAAGIRLLKKAGSGGLN